MDLDYRNPGLVLEHAKAEAVGQIGWESPSNIAIIKYWGKHGRQLPKNASLSFTLSHSVTRTWLSYAPGNKDTGSGPIRLKFYFEDKPNLAFGQRVEKFFEGLLDIFPFLSELEIEIRTDNTFPHSSGIASSASGMSALAMALCALEHQLFGTLANESDFLQKASYIARLGSGSACRSVFPGLVVWGEHAAVQGSSDLFALPLGEDSIHPVFNTFHDDIILVSKGEKKVSSSIGHGLMDNNRYAENRYAEAREHFDKLLEYLAAGDVHGFGRIAEAEALSLHALMMTSNPPFILMEPASLAIIQQIQNFREETGLPVYFTLDAGPNIHLLYPDEIVTAVDAWLETVLIPTIGEFRIIKDRVGSGPRKLA